MSRFWAECLQAAVKQGCDLGVRPVGGDFETLGRLNLEHKTSWHPLIPTFDPELNVLTNANSFCIFGVDRDDAVIVTHAARRFHWEDTNFAREAESLCLVYADPLSMALPDEEWRVTAVGADEIRGCVVYSGAAWVHPSYRNRSLSSLFPRLGKAYAYCLWQPDFIVSLMTEETFGRGLAGRTGYTTAEWAVDVRNSRIGTRRFALLSMRKQCILDYACALISK